MAYTNIHVILNPTSGPGPPPREAIERHLEESGQAWHLHLTEADRPIRDLAEAVLEQGADVVVACGGDGTVTGVAEALLDRDVPMAILPLGTGNVLAAELGLPLNVEDGLALVTGAHTHDVRSVDIGYLGERPYLLRLGIGWEAAMTALASDEHKERFGRWAYLWAALQVRRRLSLVRYEIEIDGETHRTKGVSLAVCNSGNLGVPGMRILPHIEVDDGLLHVVVLRRADAGALLRLAVHVLRSLLPGQGFTPRLEDTLQHWAGREVRVGVDPPQVVICDGEQVDDPFPVCSYVKPRALRVVVPVQEERRGLAAWEDHA